MNIKLIVMKRITGQIFNKLVYFALFLSMFVIALSAYSQPKIQEVSLRAPVDIKIDGKTLEWPDNKLNAFNNIDNIWYTISNDDNNIYLTVRGPYYPASSKIFAGHLTFTVSRSIDKKERLNAKDNIAITFPLVNSRDAENILSNVTYYSNMRSDTSAKKREHDSLVNIVNAKTTDALKEIKVVGIKEIPDSIISIYNTTGVKAMGSFNRGMAFTVEMAIPLKYLGLSINNAAKLSYNILLSAEPELIWPSNGHVAPLIQRFNSNAPIPQVPDIQYMLTPTDFWGEYTLAGKF
jgi:hypothetical protein